MVEVNPQLAEIMHPDDVKIIHLWLGQLAHEKYAAVLNDLLMVYWDGVPEWVSDAEYRAVEGACFSHPERWEPPTYMQESSPPEVIEAWESKRKEIEQWRN